jgi:two-component system, sensor histidine kinase PdtaS
MEDRSNQTSEGSVLDKLRRHVRILVDIGRRRGCRFGPLFGPDRCPDCPGSGDPSRKGSSISSGDFRSPPRRGCRMEGRCRPHRYVLGRPTFTAWAGISNGRAGQHKHFSDQEEYVRSNFLKEHGIVSVSNVPVLIGGAAWGVLEVDSTTPRDFSEDTTEFLTAAAALIATVLRQNARPDKQAQLMAAVAEAQKGKILLREMQHRVKNNFQLVLSSISIQKRRYHDAEAHRALDHVANRINAISLAHDQLAPRQEGQIVRLSYYIRALCSAIRQQVEEVEIDVECDELELGIDRALPVGLILNETAMNSIKHAFGTKGGKIRVSLVGGIGYGEARLTVSDNGRGMQNSNENGSGLKLIASLARQIGGTVDQESNSNGTTTTLTFPLMT